MPTLGRLVCFGALEAAATGEVQLSLLLKVRSLTLQNLKAYMPSHLRLNLPLLPQVSRFSSEFMKRKLAEAATPSGKKKKGKKAAAASAAATAPAAAAPAPAPAMAPAMPIVAAPPVVAPPPGMPAMVAPTVAPPAAAAPTRYAGAAVTGLRAAPAPAPSEFPTLGAAISKPAKRDNEWEKVSICLVGVGTARVLAPASMSFWALCQGQPHFLCICLANTWRQ